MNTNSDIIGEILTFLNSKECLNCSLLSKFHKFSVVKILNFKEPISVTMYGNSLSFPYYGSIITDLKIFDSDVGDNFIDKFSKLKNLKINACENVTGETLQKVKMLNSLIIGPITNINPKYINILTKLEYLNVPVIRNKLTYTNEITYESRKFTGGFIMNIIISYPLGKNTIVIDKLNEKMDIDITVYSRTISIPLSDTCNNICGYSIKNNKCSNCGIDVIVGDIILEDS